MNRWEYNIKVHLEAVEWEVMDWIDLAQDKDRWRDLLKAVMGTFGFHKMRGISRLAEKRLASQEGLFFVESARR
jgi:hypothetical protein